MHPMLLFSLVILCSELILAFIFAAIAQIFYERIGLDFRSIFKGVVERLFLVVSLILGYPHALTLFSALKLATRLKHADKPDKENQFNDFYLLGNLISVGVAMGYVAFYTRLFQ